MGSPFSSAFAARQAYPKVPQLYKIKAAAVSTDDPSMMHTPILATTPLTASSGSTLSPSPYSPCFPFTPDATKDFSQAHTTTPPIHSGSPAAGLGPWSPFNAHPTKHSNRAPLVGLGIMTRDLDKQSMSWTRGKQTHGELNLGLTSHTHVIG